MWTLFRWLDGKRPVQRGRRRFRPQVEGLEERWCPSLSDGGFEWSDPGPGSLVPTYTADVASNQVTNFEWDDPTGGALDPTFGSGGDVITSFSNHYDAANAVTTQPDGKVVIAGITIASGSKTSDDFLVARYNGNGTPDTTFGTNGYTATDFSHEFDSAFAVSLQPQASGPSKIVAAGLTVTSKGDNFALARFNANGTLDTTFGSNGEVKTNLGGTVGWVEAMAIDSSSRIVVAGITNAPGYNVVALARYTANGALDTTFGKGGKLVTTIKLANQAQVRLALQSDGKVVVAGTTLDPATSSPEFVLARFNSNGTADTTFGSGGSVVTHPGYTDLFGGVALQGDGKIVISGSESSGYFPAALYLLRYNSTGTLDAGFGTGGIVTLASPGGSGIGINAHGVGPVIQADGDIIASGQFYDPSTQQENLAVARVNPNSSLDPGFGSGGWAKIQFASSDTVQALALQADGRVLLAGYARPTANMYPTDVALVRFLASAPQIGSFTASPSVFPSGSLTTLTASNITDNNPGATVAQVAFAVTVNGNGMILGYGAANPDGSWSLTIDTTGSAPGTYTIYAQATDSDGALGNPVVFTLTIQ